MTTGFLRGGSGTARPGRRVSGPVEGTDLDSFADVVISGESKYASWIRYHALILQYCFDPVTSILMTAGLVCKFKASGIVDQLVLIHNLS